MNVQIIPGGRGREALARVTAAVEVALNAVHAGREAEPLYLISPNISAGDARAELADLGPLPEGAGVLMRTSGSTTGTGKIVALSWESIVASGQATHERLGAGQWIADLPYHHIAGFQTVVRSLLAGQRPVVADLTDPARLRTKLADTVHYSVVPTQLRSIVATAELRDLPITSYLAGGAGTSAQLLAQAREFAKVVTSYGMTETCGGCVYDGEPLNSVKISVADDSRISITSPVVALGYLGQTEMISAGPGPAERTVATQDSGRIVAGKLQVLGRLDDAITTGGLTVMPRIIEESFERLSGQPAVVVGVPHEKWGEAVIAVVATAVNNAAVHANIKAELGPGWAPTKILTLAQLGLSTWPTTDSGKPDRRRIRLAVLSLS